MNDANALAQLTQAQRLAAAARVASRWYARYLALLGIASFVLAATFAFVDPRTIGVVITPIWLAAVLGLTFGMLGRRKTSVRGFAKIHVLVMVVWSVLWITTTMVSVASRVWWWPIIGGSLMASAAFVGAYVTHRRSRA